MLASQKLIWISIVNKLLYNNQKFYTGRYSKYLTKIKNLQCSNTFKVRLIQWIIFYFIIEVGNLKGLEVDLRVFLCCFD